MGRPRVPIELQKETTRIRNARNYAKAKEARDFYRMCKKNLNENKEDNVNANEKSTKEKPKD